MSKIQVKKHNYLIPLEERLSKSAQLWASYLVACLPQYSEDYNDFPELKFSFGDIKRAINSDGKMRVSTVDEVFAIGVELQQTVLFQEHDYGKRTVSWIIGQDYDERQHMFTYSLHPGLKKYLLNVKKQFTLYNYYYRICLQPHAMKLYEILKMYEWRTEVVMNIETDLKPSLGINNKYKKYYEFRRRVLDPAEEQLRQFTDIRFTYRPEEKKGKRVLSLCFKIERNNPTNLPKPLLEILKNQNEQAVLPFPDAEIVIEGQYSDIFDQMRKWGIKDEDSQKFITDKGPEVIRYQINHAKRRIRKKNDIKDIGAWIRRAIEKDFKDMVQEKKAAVQKQRNRVGDSNDLKKRKEKEQQQLARKESKRKKEIANLIITEQPNILKEVIDTIHARNPITLRLPMQRKDSPEKIYESAMFRSIIIAALEQKFPDRFRE